MEQPGHRAARHLVRAWPHVEEWYSFDRSVRGDKGVEVLATVDETTYSPRLKFLLADRELSMGDHPVLWTRSLEQGRAFFSVLGHQGALYGTAEYRGVLAGAVAWAGRLDDAAESKTEAREGHEEASAGPERWGDSPNPGMERRAFRAGSAQTPDEAARTLRLRNPRQLPSAIRIASALRGRGDRDYAAGDSASPSAAGIAKTWRW